jgi:hypothetical protein
LIKFFNQCTPAKKKDCAKGSGPHLEAVCKGCEYKDYEPPPELQHIWFLYSLQRGGYPFGPDDLSTCEWVRLGMLKDEIEAMKAGVKRG